MPTLPQQDCISLRTAPDVTVSIQQHEQTVLGHPLTMLGADGDEMGEGRCHETLFDGTRPQLKRPLPQPRTPSLCAVLCRSPLHPQLEHCATHSSRVRRLYLRIGGHLRARHPGVSNDPDYGGSSFVALAAAPTHRRAPGRSAGAERLRHLHQRRALGGSRPRNGVQRRRSGNAFVRVEPQLQTARSCGDQVTCTTFAERTTGATTIGPSLWIPRPFRRSALSPSGRYAVGVFALLDCEGKSVKVDLADDGVDWGDVYNASLSHRAVSKDPNYDSSSAYLLPIDSVHVRIRDNDESGLCSPP